MNKNDARDIPIRRHIIMYLNIVDAQTDAEIGWLGDLSENGIMIISETKLPTDGEMHIKLKLPASKSFSQKFAELYIELLWSKPDRNPKYHCQGGPHKENSRKKAEKT